MYLSPSRKELMVFYNSPLGKIFRNVTRINPKEAPRNGRHLGSYKAVRLCKRSFAGRMCTHWRFHRAGNPGADYHPFHRFCQGSWLAAAGCQAHNPERVQRRVWTTQEISVQLQSGGCIALLEPHVRRRKCSKTHNTDANAGITVADLRTDHAANHILPWNFATSRTSEKFAEKWLREILREKFIRKFGDFCIASTAECDNEYWKLLLRWDLCCKIRTHTYINVKLYFKYCIDISVTWNVAKWYSHSKLILRILGKLRNSWNLFIRNVYYL